MSKILLGTDIVLISRILKLATDEFCNRVLSIEEINELNTISDKIRKMHFIAGRYAVKEAYFKATPNKDFKYNQLSTILKNDTLVVFLNGYILDNVTVSISHDGDYATATVIIINE